MLHSLLRHRAAVRPALTRPHFGITNNININLPGSYPRYLNAAARQDPYSILGLRPGASKDDVKKAYRKLAMKWHPDRNNAPEAEAKFKQITEAYNSIKEGKPFGAAGPTQAGPGPGFGGFPGGAWQRSPGFDPRAEQFTREFFRRGFPDQNLEDLFRSFEQGMPRGTPGQGAGIVWQTTTTTMGPNGRQTVVRTQYSDGRVEETILGRDGTTSTSRTSSSSSGQTNSHSRNRRSARDNRKQSQSQSHGSTSSASSQEELRKEQERQFREQWQREQERMAKEVRRAAWVVAKDVGRALVGRAIARLTARISAFFSRVVSFFTGLFRR